MVCLKHHEGEGVCFGSIPLIALKYQETMKSSSYLGSYALPRNFTFEPDFLAKFFMKIAFTHTMKQWGEEIFQEPGIQWVLQYLKSGHIENTFLEQLQVGLKPFDKHLTALFRDASINNQQFYWWNGSTEVCVNYIKENMVKISPVYIQQLFNLLVKRERDLRSAMKLIDSIVVFLTDKVKMPYL